MNFDQSLRAAMPEAAQPESLTSAIESRISGSRVTRHARIRIAWSFVGATAIVGGLALAPTINAQVSLNRIAGALDGVDHMVSREYTIDDKGVKTLSGTTSYDHGNWRMEMGRGTNITLFTKGKRYVYEPFTKCYVVESADGSFANSPPLLLSSILKNMSAWRHRVELRSTDFDGRPVTEAVITSTVLPERTTIIADAKSNLPIVAYADNMENGRWRRRVEFTCDYAASTAASQFELEPNVPQISRAEWRQKVVSAMLSKDLALYKTNNGNIRIRSMDVAADGTVFVAFQAGHWGSGWTGFGFTLTDDLGSEYCQPQIVGTAESPFDSISRADGGPIEFAAFVPTSIAQKWRSRRVTLNAHINVSGNFVRIIEMGVSYPDGHIEMKWSVNGSGNQGQSYTDKPILSLNFQSPTSADRPEIMTIADPGQWNDSTVSDLTKAGARANFFLKAKDSTQAEYWLREQLRLMDKIQSEGGPPYSRDQVMKDLQSLPPTKD